MLGRMADLLGEVTRGVTDAGLYTILLFATITTAMLKADDVLSGTTAWKRSQEGIRPETPLRGGHPSDLMGREMAPAIGAVSFCRLTHIPLSAGSVTRTGGQRIHPATPGDILITPGMSMVTRTI
jgi:hypothetical protein